MPLPSLGVAVFALAGVSVSVTGPTTILPMQPDPAHMEVVYSTNQVDAGSSILMSDNSRWVVYRKRQVSGAVQVALKPLTAAMGTTLTIPQAALDTPIWWVGEVTDETPPEDDPADQPGDNDTPPVEPSPEG